MLKKIKNYLFVIVSYFGYLVAFAEYIPTRQVSGNGVGAYGAFSGGNGVFSTFDSLLSLLKNFIGYFQAFVLIAAAFALVYAAFLYTVSWNEGGIGKDAAKRSKDIIKFAIYGIVVALLSLSVVPFIASLLGTRPI